VKERERENSLIVNTSNTSIEGCAEINGNYSVEEAARCAETTLIKEHEELQ